MNDVATAADRELLAMYPPHRSNAAAAGASSSRAPNGPIIPYSSASSSILSFSSSSSSLFSNPSLKSIIDDPSYSYARLSTSIQASHHASIVDSALMNSFSSSSIAPSSPTTLQPSYASKRRRSNTRARHNGASQSQSKSQSSPRRLQLHPAPMHTLGTAAASLAVAGEEKADGETGAMSNATMLSSATNVGLGPSAARKVTHHHLPPMTAEEKKILFDALPTLHPMDDVAPHSLDLRSASLSIIRQWLQDKLSSSQWVALIQNIKTMAEGSEHTNLHAKAQILQSVGMDARTLHSAGIPPSLVHRIYKALWVYSLGMHELITEVAHHAKNNHVVVGNIWKCYAILLEDYQGDGYVMALMQVEAESQRVLKSMEERFGKSLQIKQENEQKTQTEVKTMSTLLERSQMKSRTLLEKRESLQLEIVHLESRNLELESINADAKKEMWFTSNALNRINGKYEALLQSAKFMEEKLNQDIQQMREDQDELKSSLDAELSTNERLSATVDRFTSNILDLKSAATKLRSANLEQTSMSDRTALNHERVTKELERVEREAKENANLLTSGLQSATERALAAEAQLAILTARELVRFESDASERSAVHARAQAALASAQNSSSSASVDLASHFDAARLAHAKEVAELNARNNIMTMRIKVLQKKGKVKSAASAAAAREKEREKKESDEDSDDDDSRGAGSRMRDLAKQLKIASSSASSSSANSSKSPSPSLKPQPSPAVLPVLSGSRSRARSDKPSTPSTPQPKTPTSSSSSKHAPSPSARAGRSPSSSSRSPSSSTHAPRPRDAAQLQADIESRDRAHATLTVTVNNLSAALAAASEDNVKKENALIYLRADLTVTKDALLVEHGTRSVLQQQSNRDIALLDALRERESDSAKAVSELQKHKIRTLLENTALNTQLVERLKEIKNSAKDTKAARGVAATLRLELADLQSECDDREKNQEALGTKLRALAHDNAALQSLNDEHDRHLSSAAPSDSNALLASLQSKSVEVNRLLLRIRDMDQLRVESDKQTESRMFDVKMKAESDSEARAQQAAEVENAKNKKAIKVAIASAKEEAQVEIDLAKKEGDKVTTEMQVDMSVLQQSLEIAEHDNERLQAALDEAVAKATSNGGVDASSTIDPPHSSASTDPTSIESDNAKYRDQIAELQRQLDAMRAAHNHHGDTSQPGSGSSSHASSRTSSAVGSRSNSRPRSKLRTKSQAKARSKSKNSNDNDTLNINAAASTSSSRNHRAANQSLRSKKTVSIDVAKANAGADSVDSLSSLTLALQGQLSVDKPTDDDDTHAHTTIDDVTLSHDRDEHTSSPTKQRSSLRHASQHTPLLPVLPSRISPLALIAAARRASQAALNLKRTSSVGPIIPSIVKQRSIAVATTKSISASGSPIASPTRTSGISMTFGSSGEGDAPSKIKRASHRRSSTMGGMSALMMSHDATMFNMPTPLSIPDNVDAPASLDAAVGAINVPSVSIPSSIDVPVSSPTSPVSSALIVATPPGASLATTTISPRRKLTQSKNKHINDQFVASSPPPATDRASSIVDPPVLSPRTSVDRRNMLTVDGSSVSMHSHHRSMSTTKKKDNDEEEEEEE